MLRVCHVCPHGAWCMNDSRFLKSRKHRPIQCAPACADAAWPLLVIYVMEAMHMQCKVSYCGTLLLTRLPNCISSETVAEDQLPTQAHGGPLYNVTMAWIEPTVSH